MRRDASDGCVTDTVTEVWSHVTSRLWWFKKKLKNLRSYVVGLVCEHFQLWIFVLKKTFELFFKATKPP
jgi:hypothetical protein